MSHSAQMGPRRFLEGCKSFEDGGEGANEMSEERKTNLLGMHSRIHGQ